MAGDRAGTREDRGEKGERGERTESISRLSQRFSTHVVGRRKTSERNRERTSFYLDADLVERMDRVFRALNHALYPKQISKSTFLETIIERGIADQTKLQRILSEVTDDEDREDV